MLKLPRWVLTDKYPALYDSESATAIEQTAKVYGAMNGLIDEYNKFTETIEATINKFMNDATADRETFEIGLRQEFQDFIDVVEMKISEQDTTIQNAVNYMVNNLTEAVETVLSEGVYVGITYNETTEEIEIKATSENLGIS